MLMQPMKVLNEPELKQIHNASVKLLAEVGIKVRSPQVVEMLVKGGAGVADGEDDVVRIPEEMTNRALDTKPSHCKLHDRDLNNHLLMGDGRGAAAAGHNGINIIDRQTGKKRPATRADCIDYVRLMDGIDTYEMVAVPIMPQDVSPCATILHGFADTIRNTRKHIFFSPDSLDATVAIIEMAKAASGVDDLSDASPITCQLSPTSPLLWDPEAVDGVVECAKAGVPLCFLPQPFSGMTSPITIAGLLLQHNAEFLTGLVIAQLVRPGTPVIWGSAWTTFDMKKANIVICSPETAALRVAGVQMAKYYSMPCHTIGPDGDSHCLDEQLGWEKMLTALAGLAAGVDLIVNAGLFDSAWTVSLEQVVMDAEIIDICRRFLQGMAVSKETLAADVIAEVGPGAHFMECDHTLKHLRGGALWEPTVSNTYTPQQWVERGSRNVVENAAKRVEEVLGGYEPKDLPKGAAAKIRGIVDRFENTH